MLIWLELLIGQVLIKLVDSQAFGTGEHGSTKVSLKAVQGTDFKNKKVLDIGTGTGILAVKAKLLGAKEIHCLDPSGIATRTTKENFLLNFGNLNNIKIYTGFFQDLYKDNIFKDFDIVISNIITDIHKYHLTNINKTLLPNGIVILSGMGVNEEEDLTESFRLNNFKIIERFIDDSWLSLKIQKNDT